MAITSNNQLVALLRNRQHIWFDKPYSASGHDTLAVGSYWALAGGMWPAGSTPPTGVGEAPTMATTGALVFSGPASGQSLYLTSVLATQAQGTSTFDSVVLLYDRVVHTSGLNANLSSAQAVNSAALTRYTNGVGVIPYVEIYATLGTTGQPMTVDYVNHLGNPSSTTVTIGSTAADAVNQMIRTPLAPGDAGVRSITQATLAGGGTGTVGNFGFTLVKPLAMLSMSSTDVTMMDWAELGLPVVDANACLAALYYSTAGRPAMQGNLGLISA